MENIKINLKLENKIKENKEKNQEIEKDIIINSEKLNKVIKEISEKKIELQETTSDLFDCQTYIENAKQKKKIG